MIDEKAIAETIDEKKKHPKGHPHMPTPATLISVINQSKLITDQDVERMTAAVGKQLAQDVAPVHGMVPALEFVPHGGTPNGAPCYIIDQPDVDGALGYHDEGADGVPYIKVFVAPTLENGGTATSGPNSVSVTLSHEILELVGDGPANAWVDGPDGSDFARELCDAVEGDSYDIDGVSVSNFVFQAFFDPKAQAGSKFDQLGKLSAPFTMTAGGYQIHRTEPGSVEQVFAGHPRGMQVTAGVTVVFGTHFPPWKRPYKRRKAAARQKSSRRADGRA